MNTPFHPISRAARSSWTRDTITAGQRLLLAFIVAFASTVALAQQYEFTTLAGVPGKVGTADSAGRFFLPHDIARASDGTMYVADTFNHTIRKITPSGVVTTLAGLAGASGSTNGAGSNARFDSPEGIAVDAGGNIFVADTGNATIRKVTSGGVVTTFAGMAGVTGSTNGTGAAARFLTPGGVTIDADGYLYVCDRLNHTIRRVTTDTAVVTTLAGQAGSAGSTDEQGNQARFNNPSGIASNPNDGGALIVTDYSNHTLRRISFGGSVTTIAGLAGVSGNNDGNGVAARFTSPRGITVDATGDFYISTGSHTIRKMTSLGVVTTLAGSPGHLGAQDGAGGHALFDSPQGLVTDANGDLVVCDQQNHSLRKVTPAGVVTTFAGVLGLAGAADTQGVFASPYSVAKDLAGNVYVADQGNHVIRKVTPAGIVTTLAGIAGVSGSTDGTGSNARFSGASALSVDGSGNVFVADTGNQTIRKITPAGVVTTIAGMAGVSGSMDGTGSGARFGAPYGIAFGGAGGDLYVTEYGNHTLRKVTLAGVVTTVAGLAGSAGTVDGTGGAARFNGPVGVAIDSGGNIFVGEYNGFTIRRVTAAGVVTTLAGLGGTNGSADGTGGAARFRNVRGVSIDGAGNLYVCDATNHIIRKVTQAGVVTTLAGFPGVSGAVDATGAAARFYNPSGVVSDSNGNLVVSETSNAALRKVSSSGVVTLFAGALGASGSADTQGVFNNIYSAAVDSVGNVFTADFQSHTIRKVTPAGVVSTLAGVTGMAGSADGMGSAARFTNPLGITVDGGGNLFVADFGSHTIRKITAGGVVTTLAGMAGASGSTNGTGNVARFNGPYDVTVDAGGNVFVADAGNNLIRKVTSGGAVTTIAGTAGQTGSADGLGSLARFNTPSGITVDAAGNLYVGDQSNHTVRKITSGGLVSTFAGLALTSGSNDGTGSAARFTGPFGVDVDSSGNVFVSDRNSRTIRKITSAGVVTTIAGKAIVSGSADGIGDEVRFNGAAGIAVDASGILYVADTGNSTIRRGARASDKARIVSPVNGSTLAAQQTTFTWVKGVAATQYALWIGTTPGGYDLYAGIEGTSLARTVTLPVDIKIYVTLHTMISGVWQSNGYVFNGAPSQKAVLISPVQASTLASATLNLQWSAGLGITNYAVWIGSAPGGHDIAAINAGTATTATANVVTDGGPIYVTLWSLINGAYQSNLYWFKTAYINGAKPSSLNTPAWIYIGTRLSSATPTFDWDNGIGVTSYALWVGSTPDGYDLYAGLEGTKKSRQVLIPTDGRKIYVTVHSLISGAYQSNSHWFLAPNSPDTAYGNGEITNWTSGDQFNAATITLNWSAVTGASKYVLWVGSTSGGYDLYNGDEGLSLTRTLAMPTDGSPVYVTLHSLLNGVYQSKPHFFQAADMAAATKKARITSPANGSALSSASTTFNWNTGTGVTSYALWIGSTPGAYDLYAALEGNGLSRAVTLPTDGRKIYVTLHSLISGAYQSSSYLYTAPSVTSQKSAVWLPVSKQLTSTSAQFYFTPGIGVTQYAIWVGRQPGGYELYSIIKATNAAQTVSNLPTDGGPVYVTVYSMINGVWQPSVHEFSAWQQP